jgi:hypothetical protein
MRSCRQSSNPRGSKNSALSPEDFKPGVRNESPRRSPRPGFSSNSPTTARKSRHSQDPLKPWTPYRVKNTEDECSVKRLEPKVKSPSMKDKKRRGKRKSTDATVPSPGRFRRSTGSDRIFVDSSTSVHRSDATSKRSLADPRRSERASTQGES